MWTLSVAVAVWTAVGSASATGGTLSDAATASNPAINRHAVVSRHDVHFDAANPGQLDVDNGVLSVGNGAFAFNVDATGVQSFNESYTHLGVNTLADWGWHTTPFTSDDPAYALREYNFTYYDTPTSGNGSTRRVPYANDGSNEPRVISWLMGNPHRLNLGQISLRPLLKPSGTGTGTVLLDLSSLANSSQSLTLLTGVIQSNFSYVPPAPVTCALVQDNAVAEFSCGAGELIGSVAWASYGRPRGSCPTSFAVDPSCNSITTQSVLASLCSGKPRCSLQVNYQAGFGDPCSGQAKWLAANITCKPATGGWVKRDSDGNDRGATPLAASPVAPLLSAFLSISTVAHPDLDLVSTRVACSSGAQPCPLALHIAFPYGSTEFGPSGADWLSDSLHFTTVLRNGSSGVSFLRVLDSDSYRVDCSWPAGDVTASRSSLHSFDLVLGVAVTSLSCLFAPLLGGRVAYPVGASSGWLVGKREATQALIDGLSNGTQSLPLYDAVAAAASGFWEGFWSSGAFVDLSSNTPDPDAFELERRIILSQYLMRVNSAGAEPPQETGLLCNSWNGKHHSEMRLWHQAHWPLWGRPELLSRSDSFFFDQLLNATAFAAFEGYPGAHWPKETAAVANRSGIDVAWPGLAHAPWPFGGTPNGTLLVWESSQVDNALVIWQQPHVIWIAELARRAAAAAGGAGAALVEVQRLSSLVFASADYLAARVYLNESDRGAGGSGRYWLGPPLEGGQEGGDPYRTFNPPFELTYIALTLDLANEWRVYLGLPPNEHYDDVAANLAALPIDPASPPGQPLHSFDLHCVCMYLEGGTSNPLCDPSWVPPGGSTCVARSSHPLVVAPLGLVNGRRSGDRYGVNATVMNFTLNAVLDLWPSWTDAWGWDDGLLALSMARLGFNPSAIVDVLLDPKFPFYKNGHTVCCPTYLPGNGGLLLAVALLAGGSETSPPAYFPADWRVSVEGFNVPFI